MEGEARGFKDGNLFLLNYLCISLGCFNARLTTHPQFNHNIDVDLFNLHLKHTCMRAGKERSHQIKSLLEALIFNRSHYFTRLLYFEDYPIPPLLTGIGGGGSGYFVSVT